MLLSALLLLVFVVVAGDFGEKQGMRKPLPEVLFGHSAFAVFSVNIHTHRHLKRQLAGVIKYWGPRFVLLLNRSPTVDPVVLRQVVANDKRVLLNPVPLAKKRFSGKILEGIYSNMKLVATNFCDHFPSHDNCKTNSFAFDYFICLSATTVSVHLTLNVLLFSC